MAKVAMFLESDFPPDPRVENEALALIGAGHKVFLFSLSYKKGLPERETINGVEVFRFGAGRLLYKLSALVFTFPFYRWLVSSRIRRFLAAVKPEVLHVHDMTLAEAVMRINKDRLPVVLDLHENKPAIMHHYAHTNRFPGNLLINLKRWERKQDDLIKRAKHVVTVTEEAKHHYQQTIGLPGEKFTAVPNTVNLDEFLNYGTSNNLVARFQQTFNLLYLGDTGIRRGLLTVIEALPRLKRSIPNVLVIVVGSSSADAQLLQRATELEVLGHVAFEGWQDLKLFPSYIEASHICLSPIHRNLHHDTTFANKVFQYMAVGRAQVVSDCPPQARVVEDLGIGLVHQAENVGDFARCIEQLYNDDAARATMESRARQGMAREWNWEVKGAGLIELYQSLENRDS